jgi:putative ABC transport system permease protein
VLIISHGLWQRQFGGREDVVGRTIEINNQAAEIIGVAPADLAIHFGVGSGLNTRVDMWTPARINPATWPARRNVIWRVVGRMKPGVSIEAARADVGRLSNTLVEAEPGRQTAGWQMDVFPMIEDLTADVRPMLWPLFGAVGFVLLIACANVSNLFLARASSREREFAIRSALGGARTRLVRQLMVESGVIAAAGGALGLLLAFGGIKLLVALRPANLPRLDTVGIDGSVLGFTAIAAVLSAFLFGLIPAFQASQPKISQVLKDRGRSAVHKGHRVFRNTLVVAQVALSVVLLIGAGLMIRSFRAQQNVALGYQPDGVLTFNLQLPGNRYPAPQRQEFFRSFTDRLGAVPGVTHVSAATPIPLIDAQFTGRYGPPEALGDETRYGQADYPLAQKDVQAGVRYQIDRLADFLELLAQTPDVGGTSLLDSCAILATTELFDGNVHSYVQHPLVVAGSARGRLKTGLHLKESGSPCKLVLSLMRAVLGPQVAEFGTQQYRVREGLAAIEGAGV